MFHKINTAADYRLSTEQVNLADHLGIDYVTVTLEWTPVENMTYSVSISPPADVLFARNTSWNLTLSYNTSYSVNIHATYCGYSNNIITTQMLKYGELD